MSPRSRRTHSQSAKSSKSVFPTPPRDPEPDGAGRRQARLEHLLLHELESLISDEATDPALRGVRLLSLHLSPDAGHARVAYVVTAALSREREVRRSSSEGLTRATGFLRTRLAAQLALKKVPGLSFTFVGVDDAGGDPCLG